MQESKKFDCDDCDERDVSGAVNRCLDCQKFLCKECSRFHVRRRETKSHSLISISEFKAKAEVLTQLSPRRSFESRDLPAPGPASTLCILKACLPVLRQFCEGCGRARSQ